MSRTHEILRRVPSTLAEIARRIAGRDHRLMEATCVTVDCIDPQRVARFWGDALGWDVETPNGEQSVSCRPRDSGLYLEFVAVSRRKKYKNRVHLGCSAGTLEQLELELERLAGLGASFAWEEAFPAEIALQYRNVVLRDVEGNEFCLAGGTGRSNAAREAL